MVQPAALRPLHCAGGDGVAVAGQKILGLLMGRDPLSCTQLLAKPGAGSGKRGARRRRSLRSAFLSFAAFAGFARAFGGGSSSLSPALVFVLQPSSATRPARPRLQTRPISDPLPQQALAPESPPFPARGPTRVPRDMEGADAVHAQPLKAEDGEHRPRFHHEAGSCKAGGIRN